MQKSQLETGRATNGSLDASGTKHPSSTTPPGRLLPECSPGMCIYMM